jgi:hypothetical protein
MLGALTPLPLQQLSKVRWLQRAEGLPQFIGLMTFELINKETLYTPVTLFVMPFSADTDRPCCRLKALSSPLLLVGPLGSPRAYPYE